MVILYYHIPLRDNTGYLNRKKVLDMISRYKNPTPDVRPYALFPAYHMRSHNSSNASTATCGYFWRSTCGGDAATASWSTRSTAPKSSTPISRPRSAERLPDPALSRQRRVRRLCDLQIRCRGGRSRNNVFTSGMDGTTWKVELSEDGGKTWSAMTAMAQNYGDRWIRGYHIGVETSGGKRHQPLLPPIPVQAEKSRSDRHRGSCDRQFQPCLHADALQRATISPKPRVIDPPGLIYRAGSPVAARHREGGGGTG